MRGAAVEHLFAVSSGLDSAVVGEQQVLGQVRRAYAAAEANRTVGRVLHELAQRALSVGKRVHSETGIDAAGASVVSVALGMADTKLAGAAGATSGLGLAGRAAVVVGAGSMGALAAKQLARAGVERIHVVNRTLPRAKRLADKIRELGVVADAFPLDHLTPTITDADVVVTCTGAVRPVVSLADVHRGLAHGQEPKQLVICDLGMPRNVDPAVAGLPGVFVVDMDRIQHLSGLLRRILQHYCPETVAAAEDFAREVTYIAVSSLGPNIRPDPASGLPAIRPAEIQPTWVTAPLLYGISQASSRLIPRFVKRTRSG